MLTQVPNSTRSNSSSILSDTREREERKRLPALFEISLSGRELVLKATDELNDARWGAWFGQLQTALKEKIWSGKTFDECKIDFSNCLWADPLPLLSLGISLNKFEFLGGKVTIILPTICPTKNFSSEKYPDIEAQQARFLKFLAREGFLDMLISSPTYLPMGREELKNSANREVKLGNLPLDKQLIQKLQNIPVNLAYERSTCLPATLLNIEVSDGAPDAAPLVAIDNFVERMLFQTISQSVYDEAPPWAQDGLRYRMMTFLRETLHNISEHAYKGEKTGLAGIYIRYREGAFGEAKATWEKRAQLLERESEQHRTPLLKSPVMRETFPNSRTGFFEIFVIDAGQGVCHTLSKKLPKEEVNPLHKALLQIFNEGCSSKGLDRPTRFGGLYLVGELLQPNKDYFRVFDNDTWWGTQLPLEKTQSGSQPAGSFVWLGRSQEHCAQKVVGLAWTTRLSWLEAQDVSGQQQPWIGIPNKNIQRNILKTYINQSDLPESDDAIQVYDLRFPPHPPHTNKQHIDSWPIFVLPEPWWMKNHIQDELSKILDHVWKLNPAQQKRCLIIGDIPPEEATTYIAATDRAAKLEHAPYHKIDKIILVTRELRACVLLPTTNGRFAKNETATKKFINGENLQTSSLPQYSLQNYLAALRHHDADCLKKIIHQPNRNGEYSDFLDEQVNWHGGLILDGYLDFPQTLTHPLCRSIYSISLQRLTGLFPRHNCHLAALDSLVESLVTRFNAHRHPRYSQAKKESLIIQIGSVKVSGSTEEIGKLKDAVLFHFFQHPSGKAKGRFLLPWIGPKVSHEKKQNEMGCFERVGRTPVIARDGWKAFHLPRFNDDETSAYEQSPKESYHAWQEPSRTPMKVGHWSYGGHHEILSINLLLAFDTELDRISLALGGSLARFTYANLFRVFGINETQLNEQGRELISAIKQDKYRYQLSKKGDSFPLLIYPSHPVTDHIIDRFLGLLTKEHLETIRARLIAILPVRRHRTGSGLQVSGITLERLTKAATPDTPIIFLDDALVTGRTYSEMKRLLCSMGFRDIRSIVLLDRQRLPSVDHMKNDKNICYWRLDVPPIGSKAHCPLCHALDKARVNSATLASAAHRKRVASWCESWSERNPSTQWGDTGLRPIPLTLNKANRKFGIKRDSDGTYKQIGGDSQQIRITNSAGLIAWVTELHTVTSRDDLPLRILETESLSSEVIIQLLASQLLLFSGEFDAALAKHLILNLLNALWDSPSHDRHTALASLTLISSPYTALHAALEEFLDANHLDQLKDRNIDFILFLALTLSDTQHNLKHIFTDPRLETSNRLLKPCGKPDQYYRLHREVKDVLGKAHSSPLHRLAKCSPSIELIKSVFGMDVLASAAQVESVIEATHRYWIRPDTPAHKEYSVLRTSVDQKEDELRKEMLELLEFSNAATGPRQNRMLLKLKELSIDILASGELLHAGLFLPIGIQTIKENGEVSLIGELIRLSNSIERNENAQNVEWHIPGNNEAKSMLLKLEKPDLEEAFVVWDAEIKEAVKDIISNSRHTPDIQIDNPWNSRTPSKAHQWCRAQLSEKYLQIEIVSKCSSTARNIKTKTQHSHSHQVISEIGGNVDYSDNSNQELLTVISLPFAHTLKA